MRFQSLVTKSGDLRALTRGIAEAIEPPYGNRVTFAGQIEHARKLGPVLFGAARLLNERALDTSLAQGFLLEACILLPGAHSRITN
jgi:hypothetical protein